MCYKSATDVGVKQAIHQIKLFFTKVIASFKNRSEPEITALVPEEQKLKARKQTASVNVFTTRCRKRSIPLNVVKEILHLDEMQQYFVS